MIQSMLCCSHMRIWNSLRSCSFRR